MAVSIRRLRNVPNQLRAATSIARQEAPGLPALAAYRLSGGRVVRSPELYRAGIVWQQFTLGRLPGMTSLTERAYFSWHARELFTGAGTIVDLGSWFGSTTAALASGLVKNRRPRARQATIHAYERFAWEPWMDDYADRARRGPYRQGESFRPEFDLVTARWRDRIEVHPGDLFAQRRPEQPIEVLLVDAMKSWALAEYIAGEFFAGLAPGRSAIIHQDFSHCYTPWIHLISYRLRDTFVSAHDVPESETHVLRTVGELPAPGELSLSREAFDDDEIRRAFAYSRSITPAAKHSGIHAAQVMLAVYDGDLDAARGQLGALERRGELSEMHASALALELDNARLRVASATQ
jgi:hypothetical protein